MRPVGGYHTENEYNASKTQILVRKSVFALMYVWFDISGKKIDVAVFRGCLPYKINPFPQKSQYSTGHHTPTMGSADSSWHFRAIQRGGAVVAVML